MSRQATDQLYIELDYYYPEEYYVYTAEAVAAQSVSATFACDATKLGAPKEAEAALTVSVTQTATAARQLETSSTQTVQFTQSAQAGKIVDQVITFDGLMSVSVTAIAFKNHTAVLDTAFTWYALGVANRTFDITLANLANLDSQAVKTVAVTSTMATSVSLSITATATKPTTSNLSSESTLSINAGKLKLAQSTQSAEFTIPPTTRYFGTGRPRHLGDPVGGYTSSYSKFGTGSLAGYYQVGYLSPYAPLATNNDYAFEFYYYRPNTSAQLNLRFYGWLVITSPSGTSPNITITLQLNSSTKTTYTGTPLATGTWHHILVLRDISANQSAFFINGTRVHTYTGTVGGHNGQFVIDNVGYNSYIDELSYHYRTTLGYNTTDTTITVPTSARVNDPATTQFLYHFDGNGNDDISVLQSASASLTTAATISATAEPLTKIASADLEVDSTQTASVTKLVDGESTQSSEFTQSTTGIRVRYADSSQSAEFTESAVVGAVKQFEITLDGLLSATVTAVATLRADVDLESAATLTVAAVKTVDTQATLSAEFAESASITFFAGIDADLSSEFTESATVDRFRYGLADLSSEFTQTSDVIYIKPAAADLQAEFTQSATVIRQRPGSADLDSEFAQSATVYRIKQFASALTVSATQTTLAVKTVDTDSSLTADFTQSTQAVKTTDVISTESAEFAQSVAVNYTAGAEIDQLVAFTSNITVNADYRPDVYLESSAAVTAIVGVIKPFVVEKPISGVGFVDNFILIDHHQSIGDAQDDTFLIAFWAHDAQGPLLETYAAFQAVTLDTGYINFNGNTAEFVGVPISGDFGSVDLKKLTWNLDSVEGWHHYIFYQDQEVLAQNQQTQTNVKLYVDGVLQSGPSITLIPDIRSPASPIYRDHIGLYTPLPDGTSNKWLEWYIGGYGGALRHNFDQISIGVRGYFTNFQGGLHQFLAYWGTVPDMTTTSERQKLYDGYRYLGTDGTLTGLSQPNIYIPLEDYRTVLQRGSLPESTLLWRDLGELVNTPNDNVDSYDTEPHTAQSSDDYYSGGMLSRFYITIGFIGVFQYQSELTAQFTQTVDNVRIRSNGADLAIESVLDCSAVKSTGIVADFDAEFTQSATAYRIKQFEATLNSEFTQDAQQGFLREFAADLSSDFTQTTDADKILPIRAQADLQAEATVAAEVYKVKSFTSDLTAEASVSADVTVIPPQRAQADLTAEFALSCEPVANLDAITLQISAGTLTCAPVKTARAQAQLDADSELTSGVVSLIGVVAQLDAGVFTVTVGDVINIDPYLTLLITPETRQITVRPESRTLTVEQETRTFTLGGY